MKNVGSENPMKASVVATWSKNEYGRLADRTPTGIAMRSARICAEPSTKRVVTSRCLIRTSTFTRLTNE